jgi:hypothetical protein
MTFTLGGCAYIGTLSDVAYHLQTYISDCTVSAKTMSRLSCHLVWCDLSHLNRAIDGAAKFFAEKGIETSRAQNSNVKHSVKTEHIVFMQRLPIRPPQRSENDSFCVLQSHPRRSTTTSDKSGFAECKIYHPHITQRYQIAKGAETPGMFA